MSSLDLNNTFGALLLATIISASLYGVTCLQCWNYFQNYSDPLLIKLSVSALLVLETLHSAFGIHVIYYYVILNYMNPVALEKATWSAASVIIVTSLITTIVHMFFIWRVYIVSGKFAPLASVLAFLEIIRLGDGLYISIAALQLEFFADFKTDPKISIPQDVALSLGTAIDLLIAGTLTYYLQSSKSGIPATNRIVNRLMVHAINNGIITSLADVLCLTMGLAQKDNLIYLAIYQCIGNLYTNSMLATLNTRKRLSNVHGQALELSGMKSSFSHTFNQGRLPTSTVSQSATMMGSLNKALEETFHDDYSQDLEVTVHKARITDDE